MGADIDYAEVREIFRRARKARASDIHLVAGLPPAFRIDGQIATGRDPALSPQDTKRLALALLNAPQREALEKEFELCFSYLDDELGRFRVNIYYRNANPEMAIRCCNEELRSAEELGLPPIIDKLAMRPHGIILVTGPTGMGKTTTMHYMIDLINRNRRCKIVTVEDPIEYVHAPKQAIIVQQELYTDTLSFHRALVHILRQDPDVIGIGEMRDQESIRVALEAAETGHLVLATLHTPDTSQTLDRIVAGFPSNDQNQIRTQLAGSLQAIVAQKLIIRADKRGLCLAYEMMIANAAIRNLIRDNETYKLYSIMQTGMREGMITFEECLVNHYRAGAITYNAAIAHAPRPAEVRRSLEAAGISAPAAS
ncbi:MAG: PilT/PilU family type 4a pilus ATPase [Planctomycetes bacterium]|nr:PilT/PilU family type 4a pilus ATPase [Planctomycetota bacterium]